MTERVCVLFTSNRSSFLVYASCVFTGMKGWYPKSFFGLPRCQKLLAKVCTPSDLRILTTLARISEDRR